MSKKVKVIIMKDRIPFYNVVLAEDYYKVLKELSAGDCEIEIEDDDFEACQGALAIFDNWQSKIKEWKKQNSKRTNRERDK